MGSLGSEIGLRALLASRTALETIGHNVSNANTDGYSRQRIDLGTARPQNLRGLQLGAGVRADSVTRTVDELLNGRLVKQTGSLYRLDAQLTEMTSVEALLDEPGGEGLGALLDDMFSAFSALSANTEDIVYRTGAVQGAISITNRLHQVVDEVDQLQRDAQAKAGFLASDINIKAERILKLNQEVSKVEATGVPANDLRDQRDQAIRELAQLVDVTVREDSSGIVRIQVDGQLLVGAQSIHEMTVEAGDRGELTMRLDGASRPIQPKGGELAGVAAFAQGFVNDLRSELDNYARSLVLEFNRVHSTGVGLSGGFKSLSGESSVPDVDGDGDRRDSLLANAGFEFPVEAGELFVTIVDDASGDLRQVKLTVDPSRDSVGTFLDKLDAIPELSASLDGFGRVSVVSESGKTFHFGRPLDSRPDESGTFGGGHASATMPFNAPVSLPPGGTLQLQGATSAFTLTFNASSFENIAAASAEEIAQVINGDPGAIANSLRAVVVGDRVALQTGGTGSSETFSVLGGTALGALGWSAGSYVGQDVAVNVELSGEYSGSVNNQWTFEPSGDGVIGTTPGLSILVRDSSGALVSTLEVGDTYSSGTPLLVADGVSVSFSGGAVSATEGDVFTTNVIRDSDTSDILVALGLNGLFQGTDATTIGVREAIQRDPSLLAASATGAVGDSGALRDVLRLQSSDVDALGGSFGEFYSTLIGGIGFEISSTRSAAEVETFLVQSLEERRQSIAGVNVDEELVNMVSYEQAYNAAAQFLQVINQMEDEVLRLV
ncbi:MAG: flagellar hook-associated protein FlgK [Planctomycetota bacterium]